MVLDQLERARMTQPAVVEQVLSASLVQDNLDGIGLNEAQGDAQVSGTFSFVATWYFSADPGGVDEGECWIKSWKDDIQSHNLRTS